MIYWRFAQLCPLVNIYRLSEGFALFLSIEVQLELEVPRLLQTFVIVAELLWCHWILKDLLLK
jgi:hypothetical protein